MCLVFLFLLANWVRSYQVCLGKLMPSEARKTEEIWSQKIMLGTPTNESVMRMDKWVYLEERIAGKVSACKLRQAGFLAQQLSQQAKSPVSKYAARVFAQAVATAHMRGHAIVSADYAVKVVNLLSPADIVAVRKEREKQMALAIKRQKSAEIEKKD